MPKAIAQITIRDENDITVGVVAPLKPVKDQLWLDTSINPSVMKRYNGSSWDIVNDYSEELEDIQDNLDTKDSRNLLLDSKKLIKDVFTYGITTYRLSEKPIVGETYTLTWKGNLPKTKRWAFYNSGGNVTLHQTTQGLGELGVQSVQFIWIDTIGDKIADNTFIQVYNMPNDSSATSATIEWIKLEKGKNNNPIYSQAPEDIIEKIQTNTTAIGIAEGKISTLISETNSTKGEVSTLNTNYSSLNQTVGGINTIVGSHTTSITNINTLANSKAKTFVATPTTPYQIGDIWLQGTSGEVMKCKVARSSGNYVSTDWEKASKYTDDTKANTVEGNLNSTIARVNTAESSISQLNTSIKLKVESSDVTDTVNSAINNVQIGGRNLVINTGFYNGTTAWQWYSPTAIHTKTVISEATALSGKAIRYNWTVAGTSGAYYSDITTKARLTTGEQYTVSCWIKSSVSSPINIAVEGRTPSPTITPIANTWTYVNFTFTENTSTNVAIHFYYQVSQPIGTTLSIHSLKLEKGNKVTDWTPAPEDIDSAINTVDGRVTTTNNQVSALDISLGKISTRVGTVETTTNANTTGLGSLTTRVNSTESSINQLNTSILLKVEANQVTNAVNNGINAIKLGSRNLVRNTSMVSAWSTWNNKSTTSLLATGTKLTTVAIGQLAMVSPLTTSPSLGGIYTITFRARGNLPTIEAYLLATSGTNYRGYYSTTGTTVLSATEFREISATFTIPTTSATFGSLFLGGSATVVGQWLEVEKNSVKLEKGNKATDWTPAPEDIDASISTVDGRVTATNTKVASIETSVGGITSRVTNVETKATTNASNATALATRVSAAEQKILPASIISTVQTTINNSQTAAINSANASTDTKLQSYSTKASMELTTNSLKLDFTSRGGYNLLRNSIGQKGNLNYWNTGEYIEPNSGGYVTNFSSNPMLNEWTGNEQGIQMHSDVSNGSYRIEQNIPTIVGKTYVVSGLIAGHRCDKAVIIRRPNWDWITLQEFPFHIGGGANEEADWKKINIVFTAMDTSTAIVVQQGTGSDGYVWLKRLIVNEGKIPLPWTPHSEEIYSGNTVIDSTGITVKNGGIRILNNAGAEVFGTNTNGDLTMNGTLTSQSKVSEQYVALNSGGLVFRDSHKNEEIIRLATTHYSGYRDINGLNYSLSKYGDFMNFSWIDKADLENGWGTNNTQYSFMGLWSSDVTIDGTKFKKGVNFLSPTYFRNPIEIRNTGDFNHIISNTSYNSVPNLLGLYGDNGTVLGCRIGDANTPRLWVKESADSGNDDWINSWGHWNMSGYTLHNAIIRANALEVTGSKNSLQATKNYGDRLINAYETAEYFFGDIGSGKIVGGECLVYIDEIFKECINTNIQYHVFTQIYGGSITKIERHKEYFIVYGDEGTEFSWELKAKRVGYENNRLDTPIEIDNQEMPLSYSEEDNPIIETYIEKEIDFNLEDFLLNNNEGE